MVRGGRSAKAKGSAFEREFAASVRGARRTPLSGGAGGNDLTFEGASHLWDDFGWELKRLAVLPKYITAVLGQAEAALPIGTRRKPAAALREDGGRTIVVFYWDDLRPWVEAIAEVGRGSEIKALARDVERIARQITSLT